MSGHSPEQEAATYAGQANMGGVESLDRSTFRKVSEIFNAFVFGSEAPAPAPAPAQAPAPLPSLSATSEALQANLDAFAFYSRPHPGPGGAFKPPQYCTAAENAAPKNCRPSPSLHSSSPQPTPEPRAVEISTSNAPPLGIQAVGQDDNDCAAADFVNDLLTGQNRLPEIGHAFSSYYNFGGANFFKKLFFLFNL